MIEGGSEGRETDGVREEGEEGLKDPQQAVIEMDWFCRQMIRWDKKTWQVYPANENCLGDIAVSGSSKIVSGSLVWYFSAKELLLIWYATG